MFDCLFKMMSYFYFQENKGLEWTLQSLPVSPLSSDGSMLEGFGQGRVGWGRPSMVWVWIWKISPKNVKFFDFFPFGSKKSLWDGSKSTLVKGWSAPYLLRIKSMLGSG